MTHANKKDIKVSKCGDRAVDKISAVGRQSKKRN